MPTNVRETIAISIALSRAMRKAGIDGFQQGDPILYRDVLI